MKITQDGTIYHGGLFKPHESDKPKHKYWAKGQSIRLCDETTRHVVNDVAFCHLPECAEFFADALNQYQVMIGCVEKS